MNILFLVSDSIGIRNYLYSDIIKYIKDKSEIFVWSPLSESTFDRINSLHSVNLHYSFLKLDKENIFGYVLREASTFARLVWNSRIVKNKTILNNWNISKNSNFLKRLVLYMCTFLGFLISICYSFITFVENLASRFWSNKIIYKYEILLKKLNINKIFISHQRVNSLMPICIAAKRLGIEVITAIYSWDNLPKANLYVKADKYIVWSDYMKKEMKIYYPEISQDKVLVTGTPQFEFYKNKSLLLSRHEFAKVYNLIPSKNWILYSGGDILTSPNDQLYLSDLASSLIDTDAFQIIFRRSPADQSSRFDDVLNKFKNIIFPIEPAWFKGSDWDTSIPLYDDFILLSNISYHCFLAVNVGSTIAHDFCNFNKPTIYVNYDLNVNSGWSIHVLNNFQHFKSMPSSDSVVWLNNKNDWKKIINDILNNPDSFAKDRLKWYNIINYCDKNSASEKIAKVLLN